MPSADQPRDLTSFFDPSSVAVVGASASPGKWGHAIAEAALRGSARRKVYLVNRASREVLGQTAYRSLEDLPETPELVVLAVPMSGFHEAFDAALARGTKALLAINAGFAELGAEGAEHQRDLLRRVREANASLIGPNCMGLVDTHTDLEVAWLPGGSIARGSVALVSQSGNLAFDTARLLYDAGLGVSRFVSLGNQADIGAAEVVQSLATHAPTRVIGVYCEDFGDGRAFLRAAQAAIGAGKAVVLITAGGGEAVVRAARSHTGALTTDAAIVKAACRASGTISVASPAELADVARVLLGAVRPKGRRVAIISDGGGHGVIAAGIATQAGLNVVAFSDELRQRLTAATADTAATANPVDLASAAPETGSMVRVVEAVASSGEVDALLMTGGFGAAELNDDELGVRELESARAIGRAVARAALPMIVQAVAPDTRASGELRAAGIPVFRDVERGLRALGQVVQATDTGTEPIIDPPPEPQPPGGEGYFDARSLLLRAGLQFPEARPTGTLAETLAAADQIGYPVVLKAVSLLHKSDAGGVALDLADAAALRAAYARMAAGVPDARYSVEAMVNEPDAVELVVGCRRDPRFGPVLLVGLGGIYAEMLRDVQLVLAPATPNAVRQALDSLRGAGLLYGPRGRRPVDLDAVCEAAARLSEVAAVYRSISEIEVNPLLAHPGGAMSLDARMVLSDKDAPGRLSAAAVPPTETS